MIACVDVYYRKEIGTAAGILFEGWANERIIRQIVEQVKDVKPYESGRFYRRELPCILAVLNKVKEPLNTVIIDGYVWLEDSRNAGLGAYLYKALSESVPIVGAAKRRFKDSVCAQQVFRGRSKQPLYITAVGMNPGIAAAHIKKMQGEHRIPDILKRVDRLCRYGL